MLLIESMHASRKLLLRWLTWLALANGFGLALLAVLYLPYGPGFGGWLDFNFVFLAFITQFVSLAFLPWSILTLLALILPARRLVTVLGIGLYYVLFLLVLLDTKVFALYRFHLNAMVWNLLTGGAATDIITFSTLDWLLCFGLLFITLIGFALLSHQLWSFVEKKRSRKGGWVGVVLLVIFLSAQGLHLWADAVNYTPILTQMQMMPLPEGFMVKAKRILRNAGLLSGVKSRLPKIKVTGQVAYPRNAMQCASKPPDLNLLFIAVDGLRYDMLNESVMPNLSHLARTGWIFRNHFSGGNSTRFGIFSLFYGVHGSYWHVFLNAGVGPVLIDELNRHDYEIGVFSNSNLSSPEFDRTVFLKVNALLLPRTLGKTKDQRDVKITKRFRNFLGQRSVDKPFFGFLFYDSTHGRYTYPASFAAPFQPALKRISYIQLGPDSDPQPFFNRYKNSVHFVDTLIGRVTEYLKTRRLLEKTVIVVTGDHGEEFNETRQNYWGHNGNFSRYQTQVPLVLRWPGKAAKEINHRTSHMDLVPTLMQDYFGCRNPVGDYSNGRHLLQHGPRAYLTFSSWSTSAILEERTITVLRSYGIEVRDLDYSLKPQQQPNLAALRAVSREMSQFFKGE